MEDSRFTEILEIAHKLDTTERQLLLECAKELYERKVNKAAVALLEKAKTAD